MLYGKIMVDPGDGWNICCCGDKVPTAANPCGQTYGYIQQWLDLGTPKRKILLGVTVKGLNRWMVHFFAGIVFSHNLTMSYWMASKTKAAELLPSYRTVPTGAFCPSGVPQCPP